MSRKRVKLKDSSATTLTFVFRDLVGHDPALDPKHLTLQER